MAANLQMLAADVIYLTSRIFNAINKESTDLPMTSAGYKKVELGLKCAREIDRLAQAQRLYMPRDSEA